MSALQIAKYNISDASVFFDNITATPSLAERIILAPHVYGPNVTVRHPTPCFYFLATGGLRLSCLVCDFPHIFEQRLSPW